MRNPLKRFLAVKVYGVPESEGPKCAP